MEYQNLEMKECYMDFLEIMAISCRQCTKHKLLEVIKKSARVSQVHVCKESGCTVLKEHFTKTFKERVVHKGNVFLVAHLAGVYNI